MSLQTNVFNSTKGYGRAPNSLHSAAGRTPSDIAIATSVLADALRSPRSSKPM